MDMVDSKPNIWLPMRSGRWFPPGTPVSSTRKLISSSFHRLDMTLAVAEVLNPNKPNPVRSSLFTFGNDNVCVPGNSA